MSEDKKQEPRKIIHVKDLVIKADNVHFEPQPQPQHRPEERQRPFDTFFGRRREEEKSLPETDHVDEVQAEETEEIEDKKEDQEGVEAERNEGRRPFSWL